MGAPISHTRRNKQHVLGTLRYYAGRLSAMDPAAPFGGNKMSGYGGESGKQHIEEYLNVKAVLVKTA
jgi:acyl-CoA reductase-like NAD-dependent aldehyde dehydrogenase